MECVKEAVRSLTGRFGTRDPFALCEGLDIDVLEVELPANIKGFYARLHGARLIFLNAGLDERLRRVVCAHELGHALLHAGCNSLFLSESTGFVAGRFEREADLFAGYLLLDAGTLEDCRVNGWTAGQLAALTGLEEGIVSACLEEP